METIREIRQERIMLSWPALISDEEPGGTKPTLMQLMKDLKDEGNALFKETNYDLAWMHYRNALQVAKILEMKYYENVDKEFISSIFSNRAFCCLKKGMFGEAVADCDIAIKTFENNAKAYYRKVQALKGLKKYNEALQTAEEGMKKSPAAFKDLLQELLNELSVKSNKGSSAKPRGDVKTSEESDWLQDTNVHVTHKEASRNKMPKKNKKGKTKVTDQGINGQGSERKDSDLQPARVNTHAKSDDSDGDLNEDETFASNYANIQQGMSNPKRTSEGDWQILQSRQAAKQKSMGLDEFGNRNPARAGSPLRAKNGNNESRPATLAITPEQRSALEFPIYNEFEYLLGCKKCFVKIGEGIKGFRLIPDQKHPCSRDVLLVRAYAKPNPGWIKVRRCPDTSHLQITRFQMCNQFEKGQTCRVGEERCSYAHNSAEHKLWTMEKDGFYNIINFMQYAKGFNLINSGLWEKALGIQHSTEKPYIPGMDYKDKKTKSSNISKNQMTTQPNAAQLSGQYVNATGDSLGNTYTALPSSNFDNSYHNQFGQGDSRGFPGNTPGVNPYQQRSAVPQFNLKQASQQFDPAIPPPEASSSQQFLYQRPPRLENTSGYKMANPIAYRFDFRIVCKYCLKFTGMPGAYMHSHYEHTCEENVLAMVSKQNPSQWSRIRERTSHRDFPGFYKLCNSVTFADPEFCKYKEESCSFAHSEPEKLLWSLEKDGQFSISEFIVQNRNLNTYKGYSTLELLKKHPGIFCFICRACFFQSHRVSHENESVCNGPSPHNWKVHKTLAHISENDVIALNERGFFQKTAFFKICKYLHFCQTGRTGECRFAHSMLERDVWMLERDTGISREMIVRESQDLHSKPNFHQSNQNRPRTGTPDATQDDVSYVEERVVECPFMIHELCELCWKKGNKSYQDGAKDQCKSARPHQLWSKNRTYLLMPNNKIIRPLPRRIPTKLNFIICQYIREKGRCDYSLGGPCQFAHSQDEVDVWKWMVSHSVSTLEELHQHSQSTHKAKSTKTNIGSGQSVISASRVINPSRTHIAMPTDLAHSAHYCRYCGVQCNSQKQWDDHCSSDKHTFNVNSDREHQWNYRQPPWGIPGRNYQLCNKHLSSRGCEYSSKPDLYNLCRYAHSQDELDEWCERYKWRQMKREMAKQECVYSYMDQLLEKYESAESGSSVITESVDNVSIKTVGDETVYMQEKTSTYSWTFQVKTSSPVQLQRVALLHNKDRLHFVIRDPALEATCQIAPGEIFLQPSTRTSYIVYVYFTAEMFGSFNQWVIFDFGYNKVVVRKLFVEVGTRIAHQKVQTLREKLKFDRWTSENRDIVRMEKTTDPVQTRLLRQYKCPESAESVITQHSIVQPLNSHNYAHKMSKLLQLEEITRHQILSSYNLCTEITLQKTIDKDEFLAAHGGELFAFVQLNDDLNEDTDAGKLILTSVRHVLLAPEKESQHRVYEAAIVPSDVGKGRDYVYLTLSASCVKSLQLEPDTTLNVEIQFQLDRLAFCEMQFAIDQCVNNEVVFPDISKMNPKWSEEHVLKISSRVLNEDQLSAVRHIVADRQGYVPPFVMYGPFGTGKTETLAQAAMVLLKERPESRILICTQTNSAADIYILRHLEPFLRKTKLNCKLLRVVYADRQMTTIDPKVKPYCCSSGSLPTIEEMKEYRICIVTLSYSLQLVHGKMHGLFTHIFVDEAAQALECEVIKPLCLANASTCVVLAGDHIQMSPKVYSPEAKEQNFDQSLLERLYKFYEMYSDHIDGSNSPNILLSINYRSKMEILRFIASVFYGGPETLISRSNIPSVLEITPLTFYAVQGCEIQDHQSTSFYNIAEVQEVVDRVAQLVSEWPIQWGEQSAKEICVLTPYTDQVRHIRNALRSKSKILGNVSVYRVRNVPGKEFRAVFLCTVRTRHLLDTDRQSSDFDLGFLSDPKLLNTALTRAQSLVAVVGDPVALCAIGECMTIWRTLIKHCQNMNSLHPRNVTFEIIKQMVLSMLNSAAGRNLHQYADQSTPQGKTANSAGRDFTHRTEQSLPEVQMANHTGGNVKYTEQNIGHSQMAARQSSQYPDFTFPSKSNPQTRAPLTPLRLKLQEPVLSEAMSTGNPDWQKDSKLDVNLIIQSLLKLAISTDAKNNTTAINRPETLRPEFIEVKEDDGHATLLYNTSGTQATKPATKGRVSTRYSNLAAQQLQSLLRAQPDVMKHCVLYCDSQRMFAKVLSRISSIQEIEISCRERCGKAFHLDEVIVEILPMGRNNEPVGRGTMNNDVQGQVVNILKRHIDPQSRLFVCMADPSDTGLMIPINRGVPKIYNLCNRDAADTGKKGLVTVYNLKDQTVTVDKYVRVQPESSPSQLFVVRYLNWELTASYPIGIVVNVIPPGTSVNQGINILDLEYGLSREYSMETEIAAKDVYAQNQVLSHSVFSERVDYRGAAFTVHQSSAEDIESAFTIEQVTDDNYLIGFHVTDVVHYVKPGSPVDQEAANRGASIHPLGREPIPMIHPMISTKLCSLAPGKDRLTISIFITATSDGNIVSVVPKRCILNTQVFSYPQTEAIIEDPESYQDYMKSCVLVLYQLTELWQSQRLGNARLNAHLETDSCPKAHLLVEELKIMVNQQVAKLLLAQFPDCVPLWHQQEPNETALHEWKRSHASTAFNSVALTQAFLQNYLTCNCKMACKCVFGFVKSQDIKVQGEVSVLLSVWEAMTRGAEFGDYKTVKDLVVQAKNHPHQLVALKQLQKVQQPSKYISSGGLDEAECGNYSLNLTPYVHFTSPLHRYLDIVIQRMVSAMIDSQPAPYNHRELQLMCDKSTNVTSNILSYQNDVTLLHIAASLRGKPLVVYPVVENVSDTDIKLCLPTMQQLPDDLRKIDLPSFATCDSPVVDQEKQTVELKWEGRVYEVSASDDKAAPATGESEVVLNSNRFVCQLPAFNWQRLLSAVRENDMTKLLTTFDEVKNKTKNPYDDGTFGRDVMSKKSKGGRTVKHYCNFSTEIQQFSVLKAQLSCSVVRGIMMPSLQLVSLTPRMDICLEHHRDPVSCFSSSLAIPVNQAPFKDIDQHHNAWLSVVSMESAACAVNSQKSFFIHNVQINWMEDQENGDPKPVHIGKFKLPLSFCKESQINLVDDAIKEGGELSIECDELYDFLCVRYSSFQLPEDPVLVKEVSAVVNTGEPVNWTAHCVINGVVVDTSEDSVTVYLILLQNAVPFPALLLKSNPPVCTIEWIPKLLHFRCLEESLNDNTSEFVQAIALGQLPTNIVNLADVESACKYPVPGFDNPSKGEVNALKKSLTEPFAVIQGAPGTGKTETAMRLAYLFSKVNQIKGGPVLQKVLLCGPTELSVDMLAYRMKTIGKDCPKLVRVYDEPIVRQAYPVPKEITSNYNMNKELELSADPKLEDITLHHRIRLPSNPASQRLSEYDMLFMMYPDDITESQIEDYQNLQKEAEKNELLSAEVILCTCSVSPILTDLNTLVGQVIVDGSTMCLEPEILLPVKHLSPNQLILIGDYKTQRPNILSSLAREFGLATPLMQRYADAALELTTQSRMHEAIAQFPMEHFFEISPVEVKYETQLMPSEFNFWPGGRKAPVLFCHLNGSEEISNTTVERCGELSYSNKLEADIAVVSLSGILKQSAAQNTSVAVLSPYKAQSDHIQKDLTKKGLKNITVTTFEKAQGHHWDYVILTTVRSLPCAYLEHTPTVGWRQRHLGPLSDPHFTCMALTRAKKGIIILGNKNLLECDQDWRKLIEHYSRGRCLVDQDTFIQLLSA